MAKVVEYSVVRTCEIGGERHFPGEILEDPWDAATLVSRGFLVRLTPPEKVVAETTSAEGKPAEPAKLSINELRAKAKELGVAANGSSADITARIDEKLAADKAAAEQAEADAKAEAEKAAADATVQPETPTEGTTEEPSPVPSGEGSSEPVEGSTPIESIATGADDQGADATGEGQ